MIVALHQALLDAGYPVISVDSEKRLTFNGDVTQEQIDSANQFAQTWTAPVISESMIEQLPQMQRNKLLNLILLEALRRDPTLLQKSATPTPLATR